jgi:hypothetical protein
MTTVTIELPERLAKEASAAGLLDSGALEQLISQALRHKALDELLSVADRVKAAGVHPMTMEEIEAEIQAYREERADARFAAVWDNDDDAAYDKL